MNASSISPTRLAELCQNGQPIDLIDVRTPVEFREAHVEIARNVPLDQLEPTSVMHSRRARTKNRCFSSVVPAVGANRLVKSSFKLASPNAVNVEGGTTACIEAGLPVVRGKKAISLERQVRIAAGSLVLTGSVLGYFVHPAFIGLSAFVGAGLIFAGISDTCGMGMLLARMPWNQCRPETPSCRAA